MTNKYNIGDSLLNTNIFSKRTLMKGQQYYEYIQIISGVVTKIESNNGKIWYELDKSGILINEEILLEFIPNCDIERTIEEVKKCQLDYTKLYHQKLQESTNEFVKLHKKMYVQEDMEIKKILNKVIKTK